MNKLLIMLIACFGLITTACNENEFSNSDLLSKVENTDLEAVTELSDADSIASEIKELIESENNDLLMNDISEVATELKDEDLSVENEKIIDAVILEMEKEDVLEVKEPIEQTIVREGLASTYACDKVKKKNKFKKIMICHVPKGNTSKEKTLCLPTQAIKAHVKGIHVNGAIGYMGPCKSDI